MSKDINIKVSNISQKQWPLLLVELNLIAQNWKRYGPDIKIKAKKENWRKSISILFSRALPFRYVIKIT